MEKGAKGSVSSTFFVRFYRQYLFAKKSPSQTVNREKLRNTLLYKKLEHKINIGEIYSRPTKTLIQPSLIMNRFCCTIMVLIGNSFTIHKMSCLWRRQIIAPSVVNFTNILRGSLIPIFFCQKNTNPNCNHTKYVKKTFEQKADCKMLVKLIL